jgi:hypothetical protein
MRASSFGKKRSVLPVRLPNRGGLTLAALCCGFAHLPRYVHLSILTATQWSYDVPRRADARRSWLWVRHLPSNLRFSRRSGRMTYHGGLTFAALVHVRSCSANGANPRWNVTSCTKSGRRKPTVANVTHPPVGNAYQQRHPFTRPGVSGVSQLCDASFPFGETCSPLPVRYRTTAG